MEKRPALGKGLSALIPDLPEPTRASPIEADIDRLEPNDFQPRGSVDDGRLQELAQSIRANGIIQPIVVRRVGDRFQIIAGERRWRAAKVAGENSWSATSTNAASSMRRFAPAGAIPRPRMTRSATGCGLSLAT